MKIPRLRQAALLLLLISVTNAAAQTSRGKIDVPKLIRAAQLNGEAMSMQVFDFSWKSTTLVRQYKRAKLQKTLEQVHEAYPAPGLTFVAQKLIKENGLPLSEKRAHKEEKRVYDELKRAEIAETLFAQETTAIADKTGCPTFGVWTVLNGTGGKETSLGISDFLCFSSFSDPRLERKDGREMVVLHFQPRDDLISLAKEKTPFTKLVGRVWIDVKDTIVSRIEAWPLESQTAVATNSLPAGPAAVVFEDMRLPDGTWVRRSRYIDTRKDPVAFNGLNLEWKQDFSDYKRYFTEFKDLKIKEHDESIDQQPPPKTPE